VVVHTISEFFRRHSNRLNLVSLCMTSRAWPACQADVLDLDLDLELVLELGA
jgi:hypothetical protein